MHLKYSNGSWHDSHLYSDLGAVGGDEGFDPIKAMFSGVNIDSCWIYKYNSENWII